MYFFNHIFFETRSKTFGIVLCLTVVFSILWGTAVHAAAPSPPSELTILGQTRISKDTTPIFRVWVTETGGTVTLYSDSGCTDANAMSFSKAVSDTIAPYTVDITTVVLSGDTEKTVYAKHTNASNESSTCAAFTDAYKLDTTVPILSVGIPSGLGDTKTITTSYTDINTSSSTDFNVNALLNTLKISDNSGGDGELGVDLESDDHFGSSVALDGTTLAVGVPKSDDGGSIGKKSNKGKVYLFTKENNAWVKILEISDNDGGAEKIGIDLDTGDHFGSSVALDGNTLVVGAWGDDDGSPTGDRGAVYFFTKDQHDTWTQTLKISDGGSGKGKVDIDLVNGDHFGYSAALDGNTLAVGASYDDNGGGGNPNFGAVYLFTKDQHDTWTQTLKISSRSGTHALGIDDLERGDFFGHSVALDGNTLVVGAVGDAARVGNDAGAVYLFTKEDTIWRQTLKISANNGRGYLHIDLKGQDHFGSSVTLDGNTLAVGASYDDNGGANDDSNRGAVYLFTKNNTGVWSKNLKISSATSAPGKFSITLIDGDYFGHSVVLDGNTLAVGAVGNDDGHVPGLSDYNRGAAYLFDASAMRYVTRTAVATSCPAAPPQNSLPYTESTPILFTSTDNTKRVCFWATDKAGNTSNKISAQLLAIPVPLTATLDIWAPAGAANSKALAVSGVTTAAAGKYKLLESIVPCTAIAYSTSTVAEETLSLTLGSGSITISDEADNTKRACVKISKTNFRDRYFHSLAVTGIDSTLPIVTGTEYYSNAGLSNSITFGLFKAGKDIYTKVSFSEDLEDFLATNATARPEISYTVGSTKTQYNIVLHSAALSSGECQAKSVSNTSEYTCFYTVAAGDRGVFKTIIGIKTADVVGNAFAEPYTKIGHFEIDAAAPTIFSAVANGTTLTITMDEPIYAATIPDTSDFTITHGSTITIDGVTGIPTSASAADNTFTLTLSTALTGTATLSYTSSNTATKKIKDVAGNLLASVMNNNITNKSIIFSTIATDDRINAAEDDAVVTIAGTSIGLADEAIITVKIDDTDVDSIANIIKTATVSSDVWSVDIPILDVRALLEGDLTIIASAPNAPDATKTIVYDITAPMVDTIKTKYYTNDILTKENTAGSLKAGKDIYTKVVFSEHLKNANATDNTARPEISYTVGTLPKTQYNIVAYNTILSSGDCRMKGLGAASEYHCRYTVAVGNNGAFVTTVGVKTEDKAGNTLATAHEKAASFTLDTTAPTIFSAVANGTTLTITMREAIYAATTPDTGDFTISGSVTVSDVVGIPTSASVATTTFTLTLSTALTSAATLSYAPSTTATKKIKDVAGNLLAQVVNNTITNNTLTIDLIAGDDRINATEDDAVVTIAGTSTGLTDGTSITVTIDDTDVDSIANIIKTATVSSDVWSVDIPILDVRALLEGDLTIIASAADTPHAIRIIVYDKTSPTVTATDYYSDVDLSVPLTSAVKQGNTIYTKVSFSEHLKNANATGATARPEISYSIGSTKTQYNIVAHDDTLTSGECQAEAENATSEYHCLYTVEANKNGSFETAVGTNTKDKGGNALATAYTQTASFVLDTINPVVTVGSLSGSGELKTITATYADLNKFSGSGVNVDAFFNTLKISSLVSSNVIGKLRVVLAANHKFGSSVSLDGNTLAVGVVNDDDGASNAGSVYLFTKENNTWTQTLKISKKVADGILYIGDLGVGDRFGSSVSLDGDTLAVGATNDDDGANDNGAVYLFTRDAQGNWSKNLKISESSAANNLSIDLDAGDNFGSSVALDGNTLAVGAWNDDDGNGSNSGAVYLFTKDGSTWTKTLKISENHTGHQELSVDLNHLDTFGFSVALEGNTLAVGAPNADTEDGAKNNIGAVYLFTNNGTAWTKTLKISENGDGFQDMNVVLDGGDSFGRSVAFNGNTLVVGASGDDGRYINSGAVYLFTKSPDAWSQVLKISGSGDGGARLHIGLGSNDLFGQSVALDGDTLFVGAIGDDDDASDSGAVYLFDGSTMRYKVQNTNACAATLPQDSMPYVESATVALTSADNTKHVCFWAIDKAKNLGKDASSSLASIPAPLTATLDSAWAPATPANSKTLAVSGVTTGAAAKYKLLESTVPCTAKAYSASTVTEKTLSLTSGSGSIVLLVEADNTKRACVKLSKTNFRDRYFHSSAVTGIDTTAPTVALAVANGTALTVTMSEPIYAATTPDTSDFTISGSVTVSDVVGIPTSASAADNSFTLTLSTALTGTATLSYAPSNTATKKIKDVAGNLLVGATKDIVNNTLAINSIAGDNRINAAEDDSDVTIAGTSTGLVQNTEVTVKIDDIDLGLGANITKTSRISSTDTWSVSISSTEMDALQKGDLTITASATGAPDATKTIAYDIASPTVNNAATKYYANAALSTPITSTSFLKAGKKIYTKVVFSEDLEDVLATGATARPEISYTVGTSPETQYNIVVHTNTLTSGECQAKDDSGTHEYHCLYTVATGNTGIFKTTVGIKTADKAGNTLATAYEKTASFTLDTTAPTIFSVVASGTTLTITMSEAIYAAATPDTSDFTITHGSTITIDGVTGIPTSAATADNSFTLTLSAALTGTATLSYAPSTTATKKIKDVADNLLVSAANNTITNNTLAINSIAGDNFINAAEDDSAVTIAGTSTGLTSGTTVRVEIDDSDADDTADITKNTTVSSDAWQVTISSTDMDALEEGDLTITVSATGAPDATKTITYDRALPIISSVTRNSTTLTVIMSEPIYAATTPDISDFTIVSSNSTNITHINAIPASASAVANTFTLTLSQVPTGTNTLSYAPSTTPAKKIKDVAGNLLVGATKDIVNNALTINSIAGDNRINAAEDDSDVTIAGTSTGLAQNTEVTVKIDDIDLGLGANITKTSRISGTDTWSVSISSTEMDALQKGDLTITASATGAPDATKTITYDIASPTVTVTKYYADAALNSSIASTSFLKVGKKIYTKVVFSEDLEEVLATGATARPEISYTVGTSTETQYNIVVHTNTLTSGDCQAKDDSGTHEYHCLYTVATGNTGIFKTTVGIKTADKAGNTLATAYEKTSSFTLDTTAPTISLAVASGTTLTITMSEAIYATATPDTSDFTISGSVTVSDVVGIPTSASSADNTFTLTLSAALTGTATLSYVSSTTATKKIKDVADNLLVSAANNTITNNTLTINSIAGDNFINAAEDDSDVTIAGTSTGLAQNTEVTVKIDDIDLGLGANITKTSRISGTDTWSVSISSTEMDALQKGDLTITASATGAPDATKTITYDIASPTVTVTKYYADAALNSSIASTSFLKVGKKIYTKVVFSEDLEDVLATGATARPEISYTVGTSTETQYNIVVHTNTLTSGDCQAKDDSGTREYHCLYTVATGNTGIFKTTVGIKTADKAGNTLATAYEKTASFTLDTTAPTISLAVASGTTLTITMSEPIYAATTPDTSDFTISGSVTVSDVVGIPTSASSADNSFTLTLSTALTGTATLSYVPSTTATKKIKDVADNLLVSAANNTITNNTLTINSIAGDNRINAAEDDSDVTIAGTSTGLTSGTTVRVEIDDSDADDTADITKNTTVSSDAWQVTISSTDMDALEKGDLTITVSATGAPDAIKTITYDIASPTVTGTTYYADAALNSSITSGSFLKAGKKIYTKVVFSEDLEDVLATGATARPEISYTVGSETQYNIVVHTNTLTSGDCQAKDDSGTNEYHCLYTVATGNTGTFKTTVGIKTADKAGNTLATAYEKIASFTLDTTAPIVNNAATKYYADAALNTPITSTSFLKVGKKIYTKVVFSEDLEDVLATGATARPEISYTVGTSPEIQYNIVVHTNTLTSGDCQAKDDSGTREYHCLYTVATGNTGIFKTTVGIKTADKAGNTLATAYEKTASFTLDTTAPTVNNTATKYYADADLNTPITSTSFLKVGKKIYTKVVFSEDLEDVLATGATARPEISYTVGTSPEIQYNIVVHTNTLTSGDCQAKDDSGTREYHCLYTVATGNTGIFKTTVGIKTADKAGNTLATAYEKTASFTLDTTAPTVNNVATKYYADADLNTPITSTSFLKVGKKIYTKVVFSEDLEDVLATGATARPEISYTVGTSPEIQYNIVVHTNTLTSGDCQAKDDSGTREYHCLYTVATGNTGIFKTTVGIKTADKAGNTLATAYEKTASFTLDTTAPTIFSVVAKDTTLTITMDELVYAAATPAANSFTITDSSGATVSSINTLPQVVSGASATFTLTLSVPLVDDAPTLIYTQGTNTITDRAGNALVTSSDNAITNFHLVIKVIAIDDIINATEDDADVIITGTIVGFDSVTTVTVGIDDESANNITKTSLSTLVSSGPDTWSVTIPRTEMVQLQEGTLTITASATDAPNATRTITYDRTSPTVTLAVANGTTLTITMSEPIYATATPDTSDFTISGSVTVSDVVGIPTSASSADNSFTLTLSTALTTSAATLSYAPSTTATKKIKDVAGNLLVSATKNIVNNTLAINSIAGDNRINAAEDDSAVTIAGTSTGLAQNTEVTVKIDDSDSDIDADITKTSRISSTDTWSVSISSTEMDALQKGDLTITVSAADTPDAIKTITYDIASPTVTGTTYYADAALNSSIASTSFLKAGKKIYTKVVFSEDLEDVLATGATARPEISYTVGTSTETQYNIVVHTNTLTSGDCQAKDDSGTHEYHCLYTVATGNTGIFKTTVGIKTADKAGNTLATAYEKTASFTLDTTAPTVNNVATKYYADADLNTPITSTSFLKAGKKIYTKVVFSEDLEDVLATGATARPEISYTVGSETQYNIVVHTNTLTSGDCQAKDDSGTREYHCLYTVATGNTGIFKTTVGIKTADKAGNTLATAYEKTASFTLDTTAPTVNNVATKYYADADLNTPITSTSFLKVGKKIYTKVVFSEDLEDVLATGATARPEISYTVGTSPETQYNIVVHTNTLTSGDCQAKDDSGTREYHCLYTVATGNTGIFKTTVGIKTADKAGNTLATAYEKTASFTLDTTAPTVNNVATKYYADADLNTPITSTSFLKVGKKIYTKVVFSEDLEDVLATGATARPEISYTVGTSPEIQYNIVVHTNTLTSGDCQAKDDSGTREYHCLYTIATGNTGIFKTTVGIKTADKAGNTLATAYEKTASFTLDTTAPTVNNVATKYYADAALNTPITSTSFLKVGKKIYTKVVFSEDLEDVLATGATARPEISYTVGTSPEIQYNIVVHTNTLTSGDCQAKDDSGTREYHCLYTVATGNTGIFKTTVGIKTADKAGNTLATAYEKTASFTLDTTAPTIFSVVAKDTTLTITMDELVYAAATPAANSFTITDSSGATVSSINTLPQVVSGASATFTLTLSVPLVDDAPTLIYTQGTNTITDRAGNALVTSSDNAITNFHLVIKVIAIDDIINATEDDADVIITGTIVGFDSVTTVTVGIDDESANNITKTSLSTLVSSGPDTWSVTIPRTEMVQLQEGTLTITASATDAPNATRTITYDRTSPTVTLAVANGTTLTITMSEPIYATATPDTSDFTISGSITVSDVVGIPTSASSADNTFTLTLSTALTTSAATLSYAPSTTATKKIKDVAGNLLVSATKNIVNNTLAINSIAGDNRINATEDDSAVTIAGTSTGLAQNTEVTVKIDDSDSDIDADITKTSRISSTDTWSVSISSTDMDALQKGDLTITVSAADTPDAIKTITYDIASPTVTGTTYYADAALNSSIASTSFLKAGKKIYTKVVFSEDLEDVLATGATARPEISYTAGSEIQYNIVVHTNTLTSGDCQAKDDSGTREYHCLYTVATGNTGIFKTTVGIKTADKAGNTLATAYEKIASFTLDTTAPIVNNAATKYYADADLNTPITSTSFLKAGKKIYTKVVFSEDLEEVLATGATARPEISYTVGTSTETQYNIVVHTNTLTSGDCQAKDDSGTHEYHCLYTVATGNTGIFKTTVGIKTADKAGNTLATAYEKTASFTLDTTAPTISLAVASGTTLTITMSEAIYATATPDTSDFTISGSVTVSDVVGIPTSASSADNTFTLTLSAALTGTATLSYVSSTTATKKIKDVADNLLVSAANNTITNNTLTINSIAGDNFINAAEDDSDVTIAGTSTGLAQNTEVTVKIDDTDNGPGANITKAATVRSNAWSVDISASDVRALLEGDLTITVSAADTPDAIKTITYDIASPTVTGTTYYADAALNSSITSTSFLKAGKKIYTKVVFSEDLEDVLATGATARPEISYTAGSEIQYNIVVHTNTLTSGDCQAKDDSGTNEYHCLYTVATGNTGTFKTTVGIKTADKAGNTLATAYEKIASFTLDTTAPTVNNVATKYYADADLNTPITSTSFLKAGKKIYTKVVFSEDLEDVLATGATARPEISYTVGTSPETQYNIVVHTNTLTSGDCQAKDDSGTHEYHCLYTVATGNTGIFKTTVGIKTADKAGNTLATAYEKTASFTLDTTAPTVFSVVAKNTTLTITMDELVYAAATPATADFTITDGSGATVSSINTLPQVVSGASATFTLTLSVPLVDDAPTLIYTQGTNTITDRAGNALVTSSDNAITNFHLAIKVIAIDDIINATEDDADVIITGTIVGFDSVTTVTVGIDDESANNITKTSLSTLVSSGPDTWSVTIPRTEMVQLQEGTLTITASATDAPNATRTITYDRTSPTVTGTTYYADVGLGNPITSGSFLKVGKKIYTKVVFSEDLEDVLATGVTARPEISYTVGTSPEIQYTIVVHDIVTLNSGNCQAKSATETNEYHCLYTVAASNTGVFKTAVGIKTEDKAGNTLATAYEKTALFTLDTTAPTITAVTSFVSAKKKATITLTADHGNPASSTRNSNPIPEQAHFVFGGTCDSFAISQTVTVPDGRLTGETYTFTVKAPTGTYAANSCTVVMVDGAGNRSAPFTIPQSISVKKSSGVGGFRVGSAISSTFSKVVTQAFGTSEQQPSQRVFVPTAPTIQLETYTLGDRHPTIKQAQALLNSTSCPVFPSGPTSSDSETEYLGPRTTQALLCYQKQNALAETGTLTPETFTHLIGQRALQVSVPTQEGADQRGLKERLIALIAELQERLQDLLKKERAVETAPVPPTPSVPAESPTPVVQVPLLTRSGISVPPAIANTFSFGITHPAVRVVQSLLNETSCLVSASGAGSLGSETDYFGFKTDAAIRCYQKLQGVPVDGILTPALYAVLVAPVSF